MYFIVYYKLNGEMLNLAFTNDEFGANAFKSANYDAIEISEAFYNELKINKQSVYIKNNEIIIRPPSPFQYAKWDVNNKVWFLDTEYQLASETELVREKRNLLLLGVDEIVMNPLRWNELSSTKQVEWTQYRIDLLNVPQQSGFPLNVVFPIAPT